MVAGVHNAVKSLAPSTGADGFLEGMNNDEPESSFPITSRRRLEQAAFNGHRAVAEEIRLHKAKEVTVLLFFSILSKAPLGRSAPAREARGQVE